MEAEQIFMISDAHISLLRKHGQGAAPLAPLCGYPCELGSGERFVNHSPPPSLKMNISTLDRLLKM